MVEISKSVDLGADAATVWEVVGDFNSLADWHPAVSQSRLEDNGILRRLVLADGGEIVERLENRDNAARRYSYSITEAPLPVADYLASLGVTETAGGCRVDWSGRFTVSGASEAEALAIIGGIYDAGLNALRQRYGSR